jgi:hypothetical protein
MSAETDGFKEGSSMRENQNNSTLYKTSVD